MLGPAHRDFEPFKGHATVLVLREAATPYTVHIRCFGLKKIQLINCLHTDKTVYTKGMYIHICIYICVYTYIYIYIYVFRQAATPGSETAASESHASNLRRADGTPNLPTKITCYKHNTTTTKS